nr:hypothetical protein [Marinicella sp. W31]MDC2876327.1 hypothetical protein [Marinicella sp. W31]
MMDDRAMFAMGLPGGVRDAEPVKPDRRRAEPASASASEIASESRVPVDLDRVVLELKAAAGASVEKPIDTEQEAAEGTPELPLEDESLDSVTLPRISGGPQNPSAGKRLPMAVLVSVLFTPSPLQWRFMSPESFPKRRKKRAAWSSMLLCSAAAMLMRLQVAPRMRSRPKSRRNRCPWSRRSVLKPRL